MVDGHRILLWVSDSYAHGRDILSGALRFARRRANWTIQRRPGARRLPDRAALRRADGIIAFINSPEGVAAFRRTRAPLVNVAASLPRSPWPVVANDDAAIGQLAAEHFLERGYRSFAYVALRGDFAPALEEGFARRLAAENLTFRRLTYGSAREASRPGPFRPRPHLLRWVVDLPPQTAVLAVVDTVAVAVIGACKEMGRAVPDDIAVLGVNNDELACEAVDPTLSSIETAGEQIGYRAAMLLADLMAGAPLPASPVWVPPLGVIVRASTGATAIADPVVSAALAFVRHNVSHPTSVSDVLESLLVSRKSLERKFRQHLGRTPLVEIRRVHLQHAQQLLIHTDYPMNDVARRSGFARPQHMATLFHRLVGTTPTAYRQQFRNR
jgi:LacI family transcriptional regulator